MKLWQILTLNNHFVGRVWARSKSTARRKAVNQFGVGRYQVYEIPESQWGAEVDKRMKAAYPNPVALRGTVNDIPSTWTPVMVRKVGKAVQIKMRGR